MKIFKNIQDAVVSNEYLFHVISDNEIHSFNDLEDAQEDVDQARGQGVIVEIIEQEEAIDRFDIEMPSTFRIAKSYEGHPSRNQPKHETGMAFDRAVDYLLMTANLWRKNGGLVVRQTETLLTVEESDGSMTIYFEVIEENK